MTTANSTRIIPAEVFTIAQRRFGWDAEDVARDPGEVHSCLMDAAYESLFLAKAVGRLLYPETHCFAPGMDGHTPFDVFDVLCHTCELDALL